MIRTASSYSTYSLVIVTHYFWVWIGEMTITIDLGILKKKITKIRCTISMYSLRMELDVFWPSTSRPAGLWNTHTHIYIHTRKSFIKVDVCHGPTRYKRITFSWRLPNARVSSAGLHFSAPPLYSVVSGHDPMVHGRFVVDVFLLSPRSTVIILKW